MNCHETQKTLCEKSDCQICFKRSFANHPRSVYWSKQNKLSARQVFLSKSGSVKYLFDCDKCHHTFKKDMDKISAGTWCNYCSNQMLCDDNDCQTCFNKSFSSHPKSKYWHSSNEKSPRECFKGTLKMYKFNCCDCYHTIEIALNKITSSNRWCKYCSDTVLCQDNNCQTCFNKSFASHSKSKYWDTSNEVSPRQISKTTGKEYKFNCETCNHSFNLIIRHIDLINSWCKYCSNTLLCENNKCQICFNKSFASHPKSVYWHSSNEEDPRKVFLNSHKKYKFKCDICYNIFSIALHDIIAHCWCSICKNKTEKIVYEFLLKKYKNVIKEYKLDSCINKKTGRSLQFDFYLKDYKTIIEVDGNQHFKSIEAWGGEKALEKNKERDKYKMRKALKKDIKIIRIYQPDIYYEKINWKKLLKKAIKNKTEKIIYISKNNIYENFLK